MTRDDPSVFADDEDAVAGAPGACAPSEIRSVTAVAPPWKALVVDDDESVHAVTRLALRDFEFCGRRIQIITASSAREAAARLAEHPDVALILLDVVMESENAGLEFVEHVRNRIGNRLTRIILRTGQPGQAPESSVVVAYDIDDYRDKSELTAAKLFTSVCSALRAYRDLTTLDFVRRGFQAVSDSGAWLLGTRSLEAFTAQMLAHLDTLLRIEPNCDCAEIGALLVATLDGRRGVVAATGSLQRHLGAAIDDIDDARLATLLRGVPPQAVRLPTGDGLLAARFADDTQCERILYARCGAPGPLQIAGFVELFLRNAGMALANINLQRDLASEAAERRHAEQAAEWLARLPVELPEPVIRVAADGEVSFANAASTPVLTHLGVNPGECLPEPWRQRLTSMMAAGGRHEIEIEQDGRVFEMSFAPVPQAGYGNLFGRDVSAYRALLKRMEHAAFHDALTGLPNRLYFKRSLEQAVTAAQRYPGQIGLMLIDLNHFKQLNDVWGHEAGDLALKEVARRLDRVVRSTEIVARLGGDEFGVVVPRLRSVEEMRGLAERIGSAVRESMCIDGKAWDLSCAIGLTSYPADARSAEDLMRCADLAMYHAKRDLGSGYRFYDIDIHKGVRRRTEMEMRARRALADHRLDVFYQPIVALDDGRPLGCEALLRMRDETGEMVLPGEFIQVAEECGLIEPIGRHLLDRVCSDISRWQTRGLQVGRVAINVSARQFRDRHLPGLIGATLSRNGVAPDRLEVEITESVLIGDETAVLRVLGELREIGLSLAIDDFGTGYSSLSYLRRLPVSRLKIDRSFVNDMLTSRDAAVIVDAVLSLGASLGLHVLAEGIEQMEQVHRLRSLRCREGQGYHLGRPMARQDFESWLGGKRTALH